MLSLRAILWKASNALPIQVKMPGCLRMRTEVTWHFHLAPKEAKEQCSSTCLGGEGRELRRPLSFQAAQLGRRGVQALFALLPHQQNSCWSRSRGKDVCSATPSASKLISSKLANMEVFACPFKAMVAALKRWA